MIKIYSRVVIIKEINGYPDMKVGMEAEPFIDDAGVWWVNFIDKNNHDKDWSMNVIRNLPENFTIIYK